MAEEFIDSSDSSEFAPSELQEQKPKKAKIHDDRKDSAANRIVLVQKQAPPGILGMMQAAPP